MNVEWMLSSSVLILLMLSARFLFRKKLPPCLRYALWLAVALRLLLPVSISETNISILNLLPKQDMAGEGQGSGQAVYGEIGNSGTVLSEPEDLSMISQAESEGLDTISKPESFDMTLLSESEGFDTASQPKLTEPAAGKSTEAEDRSAENRIVKTEEGKLNVSGAFRVVWLLGTGVCGSIFLVVNLDYSKRLRRSRRCIEPENLPVMSEVPVFETSIINNPCLFGLFAPAVYVTEDVVKDKKAFCYVLCHENTHYRQHDPWWAFIRIICLCVHWFNPLVWLAVRLSRQDGELACDERTLRLIGDKERVDYGRTLLALSAGKDSYINGWRISTTMSGSGRQMKERLQMIVNTPGRTFGMRVFTMILVIFLSVITFTGKSMAQEIEKLKPVPTDSLTEIAKTTESEENIKTDDVTETERFPISMSEQEYESWRESYMTDDGNVLEMDLNFDGRNDLCLREQYADDVNTSYFCMLWNPENERYEYSVTLYDVEVDTEAQWIAEQRQEGEYRYSVTYYRYDEADQLHMVRYVEEDKSSDAIFTQFDLTYVEDDGVYTLPAIADGTDLHQTLLSMAKQSLTELYRWTGEKVDTACFQVTNMGSVYFGMTPEDIIHSRIFFSRDFGADTEYNLSNYDKSISSMYVTSGRSVWYSPVFWGVFPKEIEKMTDEEIIIWYLERIPLVQDCKVKSITKRYADMWTIQTESGVWFEVVYDTKLREISMVIGPYPDYPEH